MNMKPWKLKKGLNKFKLIKKEQEKYFKQKMVVVASPFTGINGSIFFAIFNTKSLHFYTDKRKQNLRKLHTPKGVNIIG